VVAVPSGPKVGFIDTSQWRGSVDAEKVAASGKVGLFPRTTSRTDVDPLWHETIDRALDAGLVGMARHRIYGSPSVSSQFDAFRKTAEAAVPGCDGLLISLDSEDDASWSQVQEFEQRVFDRWGVWLVAYYPCWWLRGIGNPTIRKECTFWHSRYDDEPGDLCGGRTTLKGQMWQYSSTGTCPGINPPVDLNWFYGTREELEALGVGRGGAAGGDGDLTADEHRWLEELYKGLVVPGTTTVTQSYELLFGRVKDANAALRVDEVATPAETIEVLFSRVRTIEELTTAILEQLTAPVKRT
jgi:Glycosyl hydrolases family 25